MAGRPTAQSDPLARPGSRSSPSGSRLRGNARTVDFSVTIRPTDEVYPVKFVSSREIRVNPKPVFDAAGEGNEVVITSRGKPVALLVGVDGDDLEETVRLFRRAKAQAAVSRMRRAASREGTARMSTEELEAEVAAARGERAAR